MLGLPSTTEVMRVIPKKAFYEHLKLTPLSKKCFVSQIEKITLTNSIKPSTMNIKDGEKYHEILVLLIELKEEALDELILEAIAKQNSHPMVMVEKRRSGSTVYIYRQGLHDNFDGLSLALDCKASDIDELWDNICRQVIFNEAYHFYGDPDVLDIDTQLELNHQIARLQNDIETLSAKSRKEKQPAVKNKLHEEVRLKRQKIIELSALMTSKEGAK